MLNKKIGEWGERLAAEFLIEKGYEIIEKNYRFSHGEIDLIAMKGELLVFVEVKTRSGLYFGYPEDAVNTNKIETIGKVAEEYIYAINWHGGVRYDVIAILNKKPLEIRHFEDAFH
ncbi:MAG: YraN family protein [Bacteroidetes bacterium]|nr:YraN family protein [Bacteroidota bacterium]MDA1120207.1 YraN family protein [Bacteroidota bacterium]